MVAHRSREANVLRGCQSRNSAPDARTIPGPGYSTRPSARSRPSGSELRLGRAQARRLGGVSAAAAGAGRAGPAAHSVVERIPVPGTTSRPATAVVFTGLTILPRLRICS